MSNEHNLWVIEALLLAEEIKHGKGSIEKAKNLSDLFMKIHNHLFNGGSIPDAWFVPWATPAASQGREMLVSSREETESGVHLISDCEDDLSFDDFDKSNDDFEKKKTLPRLAAVCNGK